LRWVGAGISVTEVVGSYEAMDEYRGTGRISRLADRMRARRVSGYDGNGDRDGQPLGTGQAGDGRGTGTGAGRLHRVC
jgi:hypothetical protein